MFLVLLGDQVDDLLDMRDAGIHATHAWHSMVAWTCENSATKYVPKWNHVVDPRNVRPYWAPLVMGPTKGPIMGP
jgi:hypothetical protein